jgi:anti-sigma regulatory factor (Ser/Thr protein kinase)
VIRRELLESMGLSMLLAADADATSDARHRLRDFLRERGVADERITDAELLLTELVSNAATQTVSDVDVYVRADRGSVRIWVSDEAAPGRGRVWIRIGRRRAGRAVHPPDDWGLELVHTLASSWGVRPRVDRRPGKTVWAEVSLDADRPGRAAGSPGRAAR